MPRPPTLLSSARAEYTGLVLLAVLIGVLGTLGSIVFQSAIALAGHVFGRLADEVARAGRWPALFAPPLVLAAGGLALLTLERFFPNHTLGYGFPRFLEMIHLEGGRVKRRWMIVKALGVAIALGAGASVGREGPIAQIGGSIGSAIGQLLRSPAERLKLFVVCGAAAGIATTFHAPIGSVMFAQEILLQGELHLAHFSLIVISTATAVVAAHALGGTETVFHVREFQLASYGELLTYAMMGVVLGVLAAAYSRFFHASLERAQRLRISSASKLIGGLVLVGLVGVILPRNLSDGYPTINAALAGELDPSLMVALAAAKLLTSSLSLASGAPGGIFGPIFFVGAMSGGAFRALSELLLPGFTGPRGSYALVGLATFLGACTHAPLTAVFLLFETTGGSYQIALTALITVIIGVIVSSNIEPESIDTLGLARAGKSLQPPREQIMDLIQVSSAFHQDFDAIAADAPLADTLRIMSQGAGNTFPVLDRAQRLLGTISLHDIRPALVDSGALDIVIAADLCDRTAPTVTPDTSLGQALGLIEAERREEIPVVDRAEPTRVVGMLSRGDVLRAYNRTLLTMRTLRGAVGADQLPQWSKGYRVMSCPVPLSWDGRTLRSLDCRARFGVSVLAVEPREKPGHAFEVPEPDRKLEAGDTLIVAGPVTEVLRFERRVSRGTGE